MDRKVLILSASVGSGHNSAAAALETVLRNSNDVTQVRRVDVLQTTPDLYRTLYDDAYFKLVEAAPWLVSWQYDLNEPPFKLGGTASIWDRLNTTAISRSIREFHPDLILCTHFLPARLISLLQTRGVLHTRMAVITTDYDFQGLWLPNTFSRFFVAREETRQHLITLGVPADRVATSGIPVRHELGRPVDRPAVLDRFGLSGEVPAVLVSAGAAGGAYATTIVQQLLHRPEPFQAVVVCGHNAELRQQVDALVAGHTDRFTVLGYTTEMPDLMRVCDLFVGKPGGLSASECMAAGLPMALIDPIPGQEERNSDYLLERGAAIRCNYDTTIGWKVGELLGDPERLTRMSAAAAATGRPHAAGTVVSQMLTDTDDSLWISHGAQRSLLLASEDGLAELDASRRVTALHDPESGRSLALITRSQLDSLQRATRTDHPQEMTVDRSRMRGLRSLRVDPFLLLTLHQMLGDRSQMTFSLS
ncbi:MGDG synthase family glycosyltransferase [Naumannella halotolerans]|uniref:Processive 1,2-diacylglycerol beta-glucosyltransferase n=1 Tax=Naumannella halotolerans TaxID=993414 RepID=A0A4R7J142_9ACTN|nr:glycosyltransferase [Naumannella halotolerans]TDT30852.1 processive 1,2-diacylglycerol beta-glucosyltransferase [Naumannella halotolerans]